MPTIKTVHHTIVIVTKVRPLNCCFVALKVSPTVQTVHRTLAVVTNSQSDISVALLH